MRVGAWEVGWRFRRFSSTWINCLCPMSIAPVDGGVDCLTYGVDELWPPVVAILEVGGHAVDDRRDGESAFGVVKAKWAAHESGVPDCVWADR